MPVVFPLSFGSASALHRPYSALFRLCIGSIEGSILDPYRLHIGSASALYRPYTASISASPTACILCGYRRACAQNERPRPRAFQPCAVYMRLFSASPTACLLRGHGRAGTQNERLTEALILSTRHVHTRAMDMPSAMRHSTSGHIAHRATGPSGLPW